MLPGARLVRIGGREYMAMVSATGRTITMRTPEGAPDLRGQTVESAELSGRVWRQWEIGGGKYVQLDVREGDDAALGILCRSTRTHASGPDARCTRCGVTTCRKGVAGCYCASGGRPRDEMCPDCRDARAPDDDRDFCVCPSKD